MGRLGERPVSGGLAVVVAVACRCRRGYLCGFCRKNSPPPAGRRKTRCGCGARLFRPESRMSGRCLECRLCDASDHRRPTEQENRP
jgi:hypothetical protein